MPFSCFAKTTSHEGAKLYVADRDNIKNELRWDVIFMNYFDGAKLQTITNAKLYLIEE